MRLFETATPSNFLWVSINGSDVNNGSENAPFGSIQGAIDAATPGTAILVKAGFYHENLKIRTSGTEADPIWIVSADGNQAATITPLSEDLSTVYGRGIDNVVISGFQIDGAENHHAIEFTQAGRDYHNWVNNVVIENNHIFSTGLDGIKLAQTINAEVIGNKILGGREEAIDLVTVSNAVISGNEIDGLNGRSGITVKGGSEHILIQNNSLMNVGADGITIGGWTDESLLDRLSLEFQARDVVVEENFIQAVEKRAINILGGQDTVISNNYIDPQNDYPATINIQSGRWGLLSKDVTIEDNVITRPNWLTVHKGQGEGLAVENNMQSGTLSYDVGLAAASTNTFPWLVNGSDPAPSSPPLQSTSDLVASWEIDQLFDGGDDRLVIDHSEAWAQDRGTISFGFNADDLQGIQGLLSKDAKYFGEGGHLSIWLDHDQLVARLQSKDGSYALASVPGSVVANAETHVALTFGEGGFKLYLDGQLADENSFNGGLADNQEPIVLGGRAIYSNDLSADVVTDFFKGSISDMLVHNTVLDAAAIDELANGSDPAPSSPPLQSTSDLVASWEIDQLFDGGDDRLVIDHSEAWAQDRGTISFGFNADDLQGIQGLLSKDAKYFGEGGHLSIWLDHDQLVARLQSKDGSYALASVPGSVVANAETHVALTFGEGGFKLYLDGQLADENSFNGGLADNQEPIVLGGRAIYSNDLSADVVTDFFKGSISDMLVHNTVLDAAAIDELANGSDPAPSSPPLQSTSDLVASWEIDQLFDGGDDRLVIDHSEKLEVSEGAITVSFTAASTKGTQGLISKDAKYFGDGGHLTIFLEDDQLVARLQDKEASYLVSSEPGYIKIGEETTATVEFGGDGMRLLINNDIVDSNDHVGGIDSNMEPLVLGASAIYSRDGEANAITDFFMGQIHDVSIEDHSRLFAETTRYDDDFSVNGSSFSNGNFDA